MGERHHVAGALDQRVLHVRHVPSDDIADRMVDRGRLRSLDDVKRRGHPGEGLEREQALVEQNVPKVSPGFLDSEKCLAALGRPPSERAGPL